MKTCENCIHNETVKTSSSSFCLCSLSFEIKERRRHNPEVECKFFKDRNYFVYIGETNTREKETE